MIFAATLLISGAVLGAVSAKKLDEGYYPVSPNGLRWAVSNFYKEKLLGQNIDTNETDVVIQKKTLKERINEFQMEVQRVNRHLAFLAKYKWDQFKDDPDAQIHLIEFLIGLLVKVVLYLIKKYR